MSYTESEQDIYTTGHTKGFNDAVALYKAKSDKWDALEKKIDTFYPVDENGDDTEDEGGDLGDIGEAAAQAFGYL